MYAEQYHVLKGSDGQTYYLIEIEVEGYDAAGKGDDFFTFYGKVPPAGVELTVKQTCNVKGCWVDYKCLVAGESAPPNTPPTFTNLPEDGIICVDENTTFVIDSDATDADGDSLTYEIVGGRDAEFFEIDAHTGELTFVGAPDFEDPQSGGNNNTYDVTIKVSDDKGGSDKKALWVWVKDVDENNGECIVIEAEDMHKWGFKTVHGDKASDGEVVKINCAGGIGDLSTTFKGESGEYDFKICVQDEDDGQSTIMVKINGEVVGTLKLDHDSNGGGSNNSGFSERTLQNIQINEGDTITLWAKADGHEFVRIDKIELCKDGEPCPDGFSLQDFSGIATGDTVSDQFAGFTVRAQRDGDAPGSENDAMIFDTANPTGGDTDLGFANQGNAIIISEDNDASDPDDNAGGGTITFDFDNPSNSHDIKLLEIEGTGTSIKLFDADGALIKQIDVIGTGDNTAQTVLLDATGIAQMVVSLHTSGAVDDLCFKPGEAPEPGSLSGRYFIDENDSDLDHSEPGVEGVMVKLLNEDGTGTGVTTTTAADGSYSFDNLEAGTYGVKFTDGVSGLTLVDANQGGDDTIDSDAMDIGGGMSTITGIVVVSGADRPDNDAGVEDAGTASLAGRYFCDENRDNVDEDGTGNPEPAIAGALVTLLDAARNPVLNGGSNPLTTTTDSNGNYVFTGLMAGTYGVLFAADATGKEFVAQNDPNGNGDDTNDCDVDADGVITGITLAVGETSEDNDAGVEDPGDAKLGDKVFFDTNGNGIQDGGEAGVDGVGVVLYDESGVSIATTTTVNGGMYLFDGLQAGDYSVGFEIADTIDSDADIATGRTGTYTLGIGEENLTVDAGILSANDNPEPQNDAGITAALRELTIDVLANDSDPNGDALTITMVDGQAIAEGETVTTGAGTFVTLSGGQLVFDGEDAYAALDIGDTALENISYKVDDGNGGTAEANVAVTFCGDANKVESFNASLPNTLVEYQVRASNIDLPIEDFGFDLKITGSGDDRFDGVVFEQAYCLSVFDIIDATESFATAPTNTADMFGAAETGPSLFNPDQVSAANGNTAFDNLDLINWILNQDYENNGAGSVNGDFSGWEVQIAVWELTDNVSGDDYTNFDPAFGQIEDIDFIVSQALANSEGFEAGVGDIVGVILDPNPETNQNAQPFIVAVDWETNDCIC